MTSSVRIWKGSAIMAEWAAIPGMQEMLVNHHLLTFLCREGNRRQKRVS